MNILGSNSFSSVVDFDTVGSFETKTAKSNSKFITSNVGTKNFFLETSIKEIDGNTSNNYDTLSFIVSDTVMARENGEITNGIGTNAGTLEMGQKFDIIKDDTVTTISFYINTPLAGDSVRVHFRNFSLSPGSILSSSEPVVLKANQNWYTARLNCAVPVTKGTYFAAVEQLVASSNMGLGYTNERFTANSCYYSGDGGNTWTAIEDANFDITLLIRINFNLAVKATALVDSTCVGNPIQVSVNNGKTFSWSPSNFVDKPSARSPFVSPTANTVFTVTADFGCGITRKSTIPIYTKPLPNATISSDTTICPNESVTLQAQGGSTYQWQNGPKDKDYKVSPTSSTAYTVQVDSSNGCSRNYSVQVNVNQPQVTISGDTLVCTNSKANLTASGTQSYQWLGGPASANFSVYPASNTTYYVSGFDNLGCEAIDSFEVKTKASPQMTPIADTGACFSHSITLNVSGDADSYLWSKGSDSSSATWIVFKTEEVVVTGTALNGCKTSDTILVERYLPPLATIDNDTSVCYGKSIDISAYGGDSYEWNTGESTQSISVSPLEETTYQVEVSNKEGCTSDKSIKVSVDPLPIPIWSFKEFQDSVVFTNSSQLADSYMWDFGDGKSSSDENPYHIYDTSGSYTVTLSAINECGSVDSSFTLNVVVPQSGSVNINDAMGNITVYPIPTRDVLLFTLTNQLFGTLNMEVIDVTGRVVHSKQYEKSATEISDKINLTDYSSGLYFIRFTINGSVNTQQVIKK